MKTQVTISHIKLKFSHAKQHVLMTNARLLQVKIKRLKILDCTLLRGLSAA